MASQPYSHDVELHTNQYLRHAASRTGEQVFGSLLEACRLDIYRVRHVFKQSNKEEEKKVVEAGQQLSERRQFYARIHQWGVCGRENFLIDNAGKTCDTNLATGIRDVENNRRANEIGSV